MTQAPDVDDDEEHDDEYYLNLAMEMSKQPQPN